MRPALYFEKQEGGAVRCHLCPHECAIEEGRRGLCGVRLNRGGVLMSMNDGRVASIALDPVEKKPLYHFHPGGKILSVGTVGCNLSCGFCQNYSISKEVQAPTEPMSPEDLITHAKRLGSFGIAYTYNEPFVWFEFVLRCSKAAQAAGLKNVLVTNGFVNPEPLAQLLPFIDAANIDLKSIRDRFYREVCFGRVEPVLETIRMMACACHVELTNLLIPAQNDTVDEIEELVDWVACYAGPETPLHFSRYFPSYKMDLPPTPVATLQEAASIARKKLKHVYLGNV